MRFIHFLNCNLKQTKQNENLIRGRIVFGLRKHPTYDHNIDHQISIITNDGRTINYLKAKHLIFRSQTVKNYYHQANMD